MGLNRIYKVIWSKTKGCYVVVSEMAKRVGRNKAKAIVMSTAAMAVAVAPAVMNVDQVEASVLIGAADGTTISANKSTVSNNGIIIGGAISKAAVESVIIGENSGSMGSRNVVIGTNASAGYDDKDSAGNPPKDDTFNQSVAIGAGRAPGDGARAYGDQSIAIGSNTIAKGNSSIAIGNDDVDKTDSIKTTYTDLEGNTKEDTIGNAYKALTGQSLGPRIYQDTTSKEAAVAIGVKAVAGDISLALGTGANADRVNAVAIGSGATATRDNAVAIGGGATTEAPGTKEVNATINDLKFTWKGGENTLAGDVVSFGKAGYERQLKHVAAGKVSKDSTDAINGSQFYGVLEHLTADPVYFYGADDSTAGKIEGVEAAQKSADALKKKVVAKSMADSRLNLLGGADKEKLSENNIGVTYGDTSSIRFRLSKELAGLTSAEFKNTAGDITSINGDGVTITPVANGKKPVSVTKNGLNNGGNVIANVAGNLEGAKPNSTEPTTSATAPTLGTGADEVNKNNAATVGDVLNAGWNLQEKGVAKDFVKPYDTVNFIDGDGTSVAVATANDGSTSTVKYSVNLGNGLEKTTDNKITVKPADKSLDVTEAGVAVKKADKSLEVTDDGLKIKVDGTTIKTGDTGLTVNTGTINKVTEGNTAGTVVAKTGDENKIATVSNVVEAINNAAWTATSAATAAGELGAAATNQLVKAGDKVTFEADKNIKITQAGSKFTFTTRDDVSFNTVQIGGNQGPKFSKSDAGDIKVSGSDNTTPVKITNVQDGEISNTSTDAINGSQFHAVAKNTIKLAGQNGTSAATETDDQELDKKGGIKFTVKSSNGDLLEVTAAKDTITITPKTATITTGKDGVPTANTDDGKLVTADQLVTALKEMGWKATAGIDGTGTMIGAGATEELIKAGNTVTFKAGNNLSIKQDGKNFIYSLNPALTGLTSAEFKDGKNNKVNITPEGITITKPADPTAGTPENTVTLNQNGLNNGGNTISNVKSNLPDTKNSDTTTGPNTATKSHAAPTLGTSANEVNPANAATVGDVLNAGWNLQGNGTEVDFVKPYDTVNFVNGVNTTAVVSTVDGKTSNVTYNVTGLPITYTDKDGNLVSKIGDTFYKVNDKGQPLDAKGNPSTKVNKDGKPVDDAGNVIDPINTTNNPVKTSLVNPAPETNKTGTTSPTTLDNVTSKLENYKADPVNGKDPAKNSLRDLTNTNVTNDTVATVGDIRNMGWIVSSDKTTGANGAVTADEYSEAVKNANEVRFVGEGSAIVSGKTAGNVRTITVKVDNQTGTNKTVTPVNYTKADGTKVYPQEVDNGNGTKTVKFFENPDGSGKEIPSTEVITSVNGPKGTTTPATLSNVKSNLPDTKNNDATTGPSNATTAQAAPNITDKTGNNYVNPNNAATVSDVLNAGWNLQGNGTDVDFVKPYDTVNFVNGLNTTAVVSTVDGVTSNVTFNVTGLPITYTDKDGKPVSKIGDNFYTVNDKGQPLDSKGNPSTKVNSEGKPVDDAGNVINPIDTTNNPVKTSLVNPAPGANKTGTTSPTTLDNVTSKLENYNGDPVNGKNPVKNDLRDLSNQNVTDNTVATVGDIRNMGWIVSSNKTTGENGAVTADAYSATVKNANEVKFVGEGTAIVSGKTEGDVRTITVKVDDQTSTNNAVTPVVYTDKDGKQVYPTGKTDNDGNQIFNTKPDGKGDTVTGPVKTTVNGPKGTDTPTTLSNVEGNLDGAKTNTTAPKTEATAPNTADATQPNYVNTHNAATVGDVLNAGWNLQNNGTAKDFVKPYDTVNFINGLNTTAVVTTSDDGTTSNVTYNVTGLPVTYTTADGTPVTKIGDKYYKVNDQGQPVDGTGAPVTKFNKDGKPLDANGQEVPDVNITNNPLKTSLVNPAPEGNKTGTTSPTSLSNVKNNIPTVNDEDKTAHNVDGTAIGGKNNTEAPITAKDAADLLKPVKDGAANPNFVGNNAATVSDVLNAGWNLQNNGAAKDFVKPYDTVNFVNGGNTTAVVTTNAEGNASDVTFNVTGLPITNTITDNGKEVPVVKVGDSFYPAKPDGTPDIQKGQDGNPTNGYVQANDGKVYPRDAVTITKNQDGTTTVTPNTDATPKTVNTNLVNPNVANTTDKPGNNVNTPNQLGNVANGAKTFDSVAADGTMANDAKPAVKLANDGKWYPADKVEANGKPKADATPVTNPLAPKNATGDVLEKGNDGKWYKANELTNGIPNPTATAQTPEARPANSEKSGLINFTESNPNNAATIGDLQNMGWVVSAEGNSYSDQVRNANEVKFVGEGTAIVTGKTDDKGIRTITVKVDDQTSTNNAVTPVVYTDKDGKQVYPTGKTDNDGNQIFNTKPDGKGDTVTGPVKTTVNGPKGTSTPTTLSNVEGNLDGAKTNTTAPKTEATAPNTADATQPNYVNTHNAATVGDVLNAGWNLQNNGTAKDFVKPYDTLNFINGLNTTAVVTTSDDGTTSNVTYNVTGLPVTYTTADGTPVTKIGDKYYKVNDQGQPVDGTGAPVTKFNKDGKPLDANGQEVPDVNITNNPLKTSLVNPTPENNKTGTTSPTSLSNVKNNIPTVNDEDKTAHNVDGTAIGGKNNTEAPITAKDAADLLKPMKDGAANPNFVGNNAATVSDVLNAGWNLQNNGTAKDFVKPFDTVNFVNGGNTTAVVSTSEDGTTSTVTYNVTGLPVTNTITDNGKEIPVVKVGNTFYPANPDGTPKIEKGQDGNPTNGYVQANDGKVYPRDAVTITKNQDGTTTVTPNTDATPKTVNTNVVNPNVANTKDNPGNTVNTPTTVGNVTSGLDKYGDTVNNVVVPGSNDKNHGLVDLSKPANGEPKVSDNTVATVGDLRNMGWIVSSNKTTGENGAVTDAEYSNTVKNANEVRFVGEGTAIVSGKTEGDVRTITVKVDDQTSTNNAVTPVVYTDKDGNQVYPTGKKDKDGNQIFNKKPDGTGDAVTGPVKTTINGPKGTDTPTTLSNVEGNLEGAKTNTTAPKTEATAPNTADATQPNYVNTHNAATVGDVLNAGWNLQNNGTAKDFVKPYDTVNFVSGLNTTAVVTTSDDGTTSHVTYNVTGLPVTYTTADGTPVTKIGDKYYKVNDQGQPVDGTGAPVTKFNKDGKPLDANGQEVPDVNITNNPLKTSLVNPTPENNKTGTTSPTSLSNVKNNIPTVNDEDKTAHNVDGTAIGGKNNTEAPITAGDAANLLKPTVNGAPNPNFVGNNAATVSDVLNAGWNLQNNGTAKDFVKPFDTVNFVNGGNTTAVVSTSEDGTTSTVTYNVTGLPVTYTTADGTPVTKIGDKYYKVNDKGQPVDEQGNPSTKVNNNGEPIDGNGNVINPVDTSKTPLSSKLVNPNVTNTADAPNKKTTDPTQLGNVTSGLQKYGDTVDGKEVPGSTKANNGLVDLSKPANGDAPKVSDNTAATVGDLRNMGWIVSSNKATDDLTKAYSDTVKNANEVKFVGEGTAIVSGKTDDKGVRTITVKVDDQVSTNNSVTPVNYTKADGTKVYPKMVTNPDTGKEELKFFENPDGSGAEVPKGDVVTSINGPEGTTSPTTLKNVKNNIPNVNDGAKTITNPDGTEKAGDVENINKAPLTAAQAAELSNPKTADGAANPKYIGNNAATVSDVLNAGWNLQNNGSAKDFVKPYDTVNFINGLGTTAVVTTREGNTTSDVTFNVKAANGSVTVDEDGVKVTTGEMKPAVDANQKETGAIATPVNPTTAKQLKDTLDAAVKELATAKDALKTAEAALAAKPNDPALQKDVEDKKAQVAEKQTPVNDAQKAHDDAGLNKVATVQNVAEAINNSGFNLKTSADGGEKLTTGSKNDGELIKPGNTVEMVAGNNLTVKQDEHGKITYATKDDVTFKTVDTGTLNVGSPTTYTDGKGNTYTKVGENYYKPADVENGVPKQGATPVDVTTTPVTPVSPVTMKAEAAKPATNNATDAQPSSALNVTSKDGKPTQITGVGSTLNTKTVDTTPTGTAPGTTPNTTPTNLVDLEGTKDAPVNKNAAATVGDLQNMGWVVSTKDGNGYKDVVKNANVVDFKGDQGVTVTGKTLADGTREITVGIKEGEVTNKVTITHGDGSKTDAVKIGDNYYKVDKDGKPVGYEKGKDGKPAGTPLNVDPNTDKVTNAGAGVVTGNAVANAIQDSGWNVGIGSTDKDFSKDAKVYDKVNPNDDVKFANGANTNVSMVTVDALNEDGTKKATTYVKVDINRDLKIDSVTTGGTATDKNGNNLVKVGDQYYKEGDVTIVTNPDGTTTVTPKENAKAVPPADVIAPKDGAMIVKNADGKDVVSATVGKDGNGAFGINGKDGKNGISMTAKDGQGTIGVNGKDGKSTTIAGDTITIKDKDNNATNIGVNTITLVDKAGNTTTTTADKSEVKDAAGNINTNTATGNTLKDPNGNTHTSTASTSELKDKDGNTNTSTPTTNVLKDTNGNTNTSAATGTTYKDKDENKTVVGPKEINISDKSGENTASLTNKDLLLNAKDPNTGVDKTSHVSGDKIAFTTTDEMEKVVDKDGKPVIDPATGKQKEVVKMEKVFDKDGKPVIDPATGKQKEVVKNPGNSTEYTNEGLKVIPNSTVARDVNGNPTFLDKNGKPVMKDTDGKYKYVGQDGKPGDKYDGSVGVLKPNVVDNTRVISFGMDKPVLDKNGKPVTGPDGNPVMTEGISAGMQQIHNVAPGTKDTDGVNVSQLRGTTININNRMNRMGAQAAALAGLQSIQYDPLEPTQISAGLGHYKGSSALALGVNHFKNESTMFHMGASYNGHGDETMMNASVTWKFGARADETAVKDTFRQGPISSAYTLQDKVSALEAQNKIQKDQLEELKALNEKQQEQIAELFKRLIEKA